MEEGREKGMEEGLAKGLEVGTCRALAGSLASVLNHRGVRVPYGAMERLVMCSDADLLTRWLERAWTVESADALFAEDE